MPEHTSSWTIGAGSLIVLFSLCLLAAAVTDRSDQGLLAIAASSFSIGALTIACGIYLKAKALGPRKLVRKKHLQNQRPAAARGARRKLP